MTTSQKLPYIITPNDVVVIVDGRPQQADTSNPNFAAIIEAIKTENWDVLPRLMDITTYIAQVSDGKVVITNGRVMYNGAELHGTIVDRLLRMTDEGFNVEPLILFLENLLLNPSKYAVDELYDFLETNKLPITEDGHFIAYKRVRDDYKSFHDNVTSNRVGDELVMPRENVDPLRTNTCSTGFHFCGFSYLSQFYAGTGKIMLVKINPRDVVSFPSDHSGKGRACRYVISGELPTTSGNLHNDVLASKPVVTDTGTPVAPEDTFSVAFITQYHIGYKEGRARAMFQAPDGSVTEDEKNGYTLGYKHGRGKKKKLF